MFTRSLTPPNVTRCYKATTPTNVTRCNKTYPQGYPQAVDNFSLARWRSLGVETVQSYRTDLSSEVKSQVKGSRVSSPIGLTYHERLTHRKPTGGQPETARFVSATEGLRSLAVQPRPPLRREAGTG